MIRSKVPYALTLSAIFCSALLMGMECPMTPDMGNMNGNDNGNMNGNDNGNDNTGVDNFSPVVTQIEVRHDGRVAAGDGIIAYGTGAFSGVDYINLGDNAGQGIANSDNYRADSFVVIGKKIILVGTDFSITIFDTENNTTETLDLTDIRLQNIPVDITDPGHIRGDGMYVGTMNDDGEVTDGKIVKVIDVSGANANIISFDQNPPSQPSQIDVDASNPHVAVAVGDTFYVYDIENPNAAPETFDMTAEGGIEGTQFQFKNGLILFHAFVNGEGTLAKVLDTSDGTVTDLGENPAAAELCLTASGAYIYFVDRDANDSVGNDQRSAIGTLPNVSPTLAGDDQVANGTDNLGRFGWAFNCTITPDGDFYFLCGGDSIGTSSWLQVSTGGAFTLLPDPSGLDDNLRASDAHATNNLIAFKMGRNTDTTLAYIEIP